VRADEDLGMSKRAVSGVLWFAAMSWWLNVVSMVTGMPQIVGLGVGASIAILVAVDPRHWFWSMRANASVVASLDAVATKRGLAAQD
jgi:hypothetical protein